MYLQQNTYPFKTLFCKFYLVLSNVRMDMCVLMSNTPYFIPSDFDSKPLLPVNFTYYLGILKIRCRSDVKLCYAIESSSVGIVKYSDQVVRSVKIFVLSVL